MLNDKDWIVSSANRGILSGLKDLYLSRGVLFALVKRELKSRYRGSLLGFTWVLGKPVMTLLVFAFIIGEVLGASKSIDYFALYLFIGLMFWGFFSEAISVGTHSIVAAAGLVQKVSFPREILPVTAVIIAGFNTLIQVPVLIIGYAIYGRWPNIYHLILLLPLLFILIFFTLALVLLLSSVTVYVRDVKPLSDLILMLLMYAVPIIYSWTFLKELIIQTFGNSTLFDLYLLNPLSIVIIGFQDTLWPGQRMFSDGTIAVKLFPLTSPLLWWMICLTFVFLIASYKVFLKLEPNFAREL